MKPGALQGKKWDSFESQLSEVNKKLDELVRNVAGIQQVADRPWWKDVRFWGGVAAIPALLLGGWVVKLVADDAAVLRLIHRGFGTEPALTQALKDGSEFEQAIERALTVRLDPKAADFAAALRGNLIDELGRHSRVMHADLLRIGLLYPEKIKEIPFQDVELDQASREVLEQPAVRCEDVSEANVGLDTTIFGINSGAKINITLGINVIKIERRTVQGRIEVTADDATLETDATDFIEVRLDGAVVPIKFQQQQLPYAIDGRKYVFNHYSSDGFDVSDARGFESFSIAFTLGERA